MRAVLTHLNAIAFAVGFALLAGGVSCWSVPAALVISGLILMFVSAWPDRQPKGKQPS